MVNNSMLRATSLIGLRRSMGVMARAGSHAIPCMFLRFSALPDALHSALQGKSSLPLIPVLLATLQLLALIPLLVATLQMRDLPDPNVRHQSYQDLESSTARVQLPLKQGGFGVFALDATRAGAEVGGPVPSCGASESDTLPSSPPLWMLDDDNSGLNSLVRGMVRTRLRR